jgi:murein DD-endopeptidase MepM/ murein hydrolase activator NlpD
MMSCVGVGRCGRLGLKSAKTFSLIFASVALIGCSADVKRFDSTSFNFDDGPETGSNPVPPEPVHTSSLSDTQSVDGATPRGPYGAGASSVQVAALGDSRNDRTAYAPPPQQYQQPSYQPPSYRQPAYQAKPFGRTPRQPSYDRASTPPRATPHASHMARGEAIEVRPGDTLYGLSRRHHVSLTELTSLNNLSNPNIRPGQKLYLPATASASARSSEAAASAAVEAARPAPVPLAQASPDVAARYGASYTVKPGDSLYGIAREHNVRVSELQQVNGISDPRRVRPGVTLRVPGQGMREAPRHVAEYTPPAPPLPPSARSADTEPSEQQRYGAATTMQPTIINGERRVASLSNKAIDASPEVPPVQPSPPAQRQAATEQKVAIAAPPPSSAPASVDSVKLRWPASGKIIAGFGGRPDGTHNDGINLQVPLGTEVHAAEAGIVAYAGSELKGYGNLVLLRHDNGWVTAYAHNDELLVKRGDKVKRGQVIAKAGKTGSVDQPQIHFELRQGSRPVDPIPYLERL